MLAILTPFLGEAKTGGQKYNFLLFEIIKKYAEKKSITFLTDSLYPKTGVSLLFNLWYLNLIFKKHLEKVIFDSRMYPRLFLCLPMMKLFRRNVKIIVIHHHFNYLARSNSFIAYIDRILEKGILSLANEVIVPSPYTKEICESFLSDKKITYIPLGFEASKVRCKLEFSSDKTELLFVGTVCLRKGIHHLVEMLDLLKDQQFIVNVVGGYYDQDKYYQSLKKKVRDLNLTNQIVFHGRLNENELHEKFLAASAFVFPSHYEGFGMVLAEALGYGLPVVTFDNSAMPYLIKDGYNGFLVENKNSLALAKAIPRLFSNRSILKELSQNALSTFETLNSIEEEQKQMEEWVNTSFLL